MTLARPLLRHMTSLLAVGMLAACAQDYRDLGSYRIVRATDGVFGLRCQPRDDYFVRAGSDAAPTLIYLGTCASPRFVTEQLKHPSDPSCFAVSEDGRTIVYLHRPVLCGAPEKAKAKKGGLYRHTVDVGEVMLYSRAQVGQVWSSAPIDPHSIRVGWHSTEPSRGGAVCSQRLRVHASGGETPEGVPQTLHGCQPPKD